MHGLYPRVCVRTAGRKADTAPKRVSSTIKAKERILEHTFMRMCRSVYECDGTVAPKAHTAHNTPASASLKVKKRMRLSGAREVGPLHAYNSLLHAYSKCVCSAAINTASA
jgi:hypothetical protein